LGLKQAILLHIDLLELLLYFVTLVTIIVCLAKSPTRWG